MTSFSVDSNKTSLNEDLVLGTYGRTREFTKSICLFVVLNKDSLATASKTRRVELTQVIDLIFTVYLSVDITKYIRNSLIKFRFGIIPIAVHSLRYKMHAYIDTLVVGLLSEIMCISCCVVLL